MTPQAIGFEDLAAWSADDHAAALRIIGVDTSNPRAWIEARYVPSITGTDPAHFTAYYEPELDASPIQTPDFPAPIYRAPADLTAPWFTRSQIEEQGLLQGKGLEIAYLRDAVDAFFLQVQGSGRLRFPDGTVQRVGFAAKSGQPYTSLGKVLIAQGAFTPETVSAEGIKTWLRAQPDGGTAMMRSNASFVFFQPLETPADLGPIGAQGKPLTPWRSIAVDPEFVPLGSLVWVEAGGDAWLAVAQDIGSAIKGPQRADIFLGTGATAGAKASGFQKTGRLILLRSKGAD